MPSGRITSTAVLILLLDLTGCASTMSGDGGTPTYACKAPIGALCTSVSGVYANAGHAARQLISNASPSFSGTTPAPVPASTVDSGAASIGESTTARTATINPALRTVPRVLRLWIAPWEDSDGDLHEAATVNVLIHHGRWLVERIRPSTPGLPLGVTPPAVTNPPTTKPVGTAPGTDARPMVPLTPFTPSTPTDQPEP